MKAAFSLWKRIKCYLSKLRQKNLKMRQSRVYFGFVFEITWLSWRHRFEKLSLQNVFLHQWKKKSSVFVFGWPRTTNKAGCSNSSDVMWSGSEYECIYGFCSEWHLIDLKLFYFFVPFVVPFYFGKFSFCGILPFESKLLQEGLKWLKNIVFSFFKKWLICFYY